MSNKRKRRAAPEELYKHCLAGGDCIPDVKNKFEQNTWADALLKIFGSLVYFGNLGIGTGRGSGGSLGYRPLDSVGPGRPTSVTPSRPNITIDPVGPTEIVTIDASAPSIVPLSEGTVDLNIVAPDGGPGLGAEEIELYTVTNPTTDVGGSGGAPTVISSESGSVAVIEAQPIPERPVQVHFDPSTSAPNTLTEFPSITGTVTDVNIFVDPAYSGTIVGNVEEVPLDRLDFAELTIDEQPLTSTPAQKLENIIDTTKRFYHRLTKQVPVRSAEFLSQPTREAQFEFENPAFDPNVTIEFERDLAQITAAPNEDFASILRLHRPIYSDFEGTVRVSRLGETGTIVTRRGTVLTQNVHYYHDISNITTENIEMQVISDSTTPVTPAPSSTLVDELLTSEVHAPISLHETNFTEADLVDDLGESFNNARILVTTAETNEAIIFPVNAPTSEGLPILPSIFDSSVIPNSTYNNAIQLIDLLPNVSHMLPIDILPSFTSYNVDYFLNPAYYPLKKKRRLDLF
uniref:Minor capsid protein L2 n=1 Tax=Human papillomavirus TaxID=10566 RepID=A0A385PLY2_9PAPI|nr:MAG: L2 protein [Human papillomavirus]